MAERLVRVGRVSSVNHSAGMVKVTYPDLDDYNHIHIAQVELELVF